MRPLLSIIIREQCFTVVLNTLIMQRVIVSRIVLLPAHLLIMLHRLDLM